MSGRELRTQEINVEQLKVRLPKAYAPLNKSGGEALARTIAAELAVALRHDDRSQKGHSIKSLNIRIREGQTSANGIAQAIRHAISKELAGTGKGR